MKAIIIDDEPKAIELIKSYIEHFSALRLVGSFRNGLKALEFVGSNEVNLIFLDINMPHISGLALSKCLDSSVKVIFTTAYSEYAVESYDLEATDYLLKPISLDRFSKAVMKALNSGVLKTLVPSEEYIILKSGADWHRVCIDDILFLKKDGNYMIYHFSSSKKIMCRESVSQALDSLPNNFIQTHRSYVINMNRLSSINNEEILLDDMKIPFSPKHKSAILDWISTH